MKRRLIRLMWTVFITCLVFFAIIIVGIEKGWMGEMPSMEELENPSAATASQLFDSEGGLIGRYYIVNRSDVKYSEISNKVTNALIATEDFRFNEHSGIDGIAVLRAIFLLGKKGGGSTITQQLAKNLFPREESSMLKLPFIKLKEWIMAVKLERNLTKQEIITLYLNTVPFGDNTYGIKNASLTFFNKLPKDLSLEEAAVMVGMLKGNTLYNPRRNKAYALDRRNIVIDQMEKYNYISSSEASAAKAKPIVLDYHRQLKIDGIAPYFKQVVEQEVKKWCKTHVNSEGKPYNIYKDGLKIYTTIDPIAQKYAEAAVEEQMKYLQRLFVSQAQIRTGSIWNKDQPKRVLERLKESSDRYKNMKSAGHSTKEIEKSFTEKTKMTVFTWSNDQNVKDTTMTPIDSIKYMRSFMQSGFMAMSPYTGEIKAWVGGINHDFFKYDHVNINTKRQVGSTIKPLLYCLAVDNGFSPCDNVSTAAQKFAGQSKLYNAGGSKYGGMSMQSALAASINNASLYLLNQTGIKSFVDFCHRCGISSDIPELPSIALGASEISLFEMLWSYTMFPNGGINTQPRFILKIEDKDGNILENFIPVQKEIINADVAFKMLTMMKGVVDRGTARRLKGGYGLSGDIAGKTGTTNGQADAWFIGFTPQLLAGAWVGNDDRFLRFSSTAIGQGAAAAAPIFGKFFQKLYADSKSGYKNGEVFEVPEGFNLCSGRGSFYNSAGGGTSYYEQEVEVRRMRESVPENYGNDDDILEEIPSLDEIR
ncbi:MAG TPA: transglycosylase domain-containing protein [Edaphocola sp.]|nr:transglycosylase domain-containing protein [Edaphocola sp.]